MRSDRSLQATHSCGESDGILFMYIYSVAIMYLPFIVFAMTVSACLHHLNLLACVLVLCWLTVLLEFTNLYEFVPWTFLLTGSCKCVVQYIFKNRRSDELILCCIMVFWLSCIYIYMWAYVFFFGGGGVVCVCVSISSCCNESICISVWLYSNIAYLLVIYKVCSQQGHFERCSQFKDLLYIPTLTQAGSFWVSQLIPNRQWVRLIS